MASSSSQHGPSAKAAQPSPDSTKIVREPVQMYEDKHPRWLSSDPLGTVSFSVQLGAALNALVGLVPGGDKNEMISLLGIVACLFHGADKKMGIPVKNLSPVATVSPEAIRRLGERDQLLKVLGDPEKEELFLSMRLLPYVFTPPRYSEADIREEILLWIFYYDGSLFKTVFAKSLAILNRLRPIAKLSTLEPIAPNNSRDFPRHCTLIRLSEVFRKPGISVVWGQHTPCHVLGADAHTGSIGLANRLMAEAERLRDAARGLEVRKAERRLDKRDEERLKSYHKDAERLILVMRDLIDQFRFEIQRLNHLPGGLIDDDQDLYAEAIAKMHEMVQTLPN